VGLPVADLMAYEYFKRLNTGNEKDRMRTPLALIQEHNHYEEGFFGETTFKKHKRAIESAGCGRDELVYIPIL
jgi:hypothetical protein